MTDSSTADLHLDTEPGRPAVLELAAPPADPAGWVDEHRAALHAGLAEHGALLVRGLGVTDPAGAGAVSRGVLGEPVTEYEGFAPRDALGGGLYSSTKWPQDQPMCMHHEGSYLLSPPATLVFVCLRAPARGGATALADGHAVLADLDTGLVERFGRAGWRLDRAYNRLVGTPVEGAFPTAEPAGVDAYCARNGVRARWGDDGTLFTSQTRAAVITHPDTGRPVWFNQIAFLNEETMDPEVRDYLRAVLGPDGLPFTTFDGEGTAVTRADVDHVNDVYEAHTRREPWRAGDVLLVDNLRTAHAVEPHGGDREIVVAMGRAYTVPEHTAYA